MDNLPKLGRYQLESRLGEGAFAEVYKARDTLLKRAVALKLLKPALLADQEAFNRFIQEAQVAAELTHPRIAWVYDLGEQDGHYFIVMRYIEGPSLDQHIREHGALSWEDAYRVLQQVGEALSYAHARGLVHRDIKPQNILLHPQDGAVLTDFGLVRAMENSRMTRSGTMIGTPQYMAPELWQGKPATPAADQYALACLLVEMLSGKVLFDGPTPPAIMFKHFQPVELGGEWLDELPYGAQDILLKALEKEPEGRFEKLIEFVQALKEPQTIVLTNRAQDVNPEIDSMTVESGSQVEVDDPNRIVMPEHDEQHQIIKQGESYSEEDPAKGQADQEEKTLPAEIAPLNNPVENLSTKVRRKKKSAPVVKPNITQEKKVRIEENRLFIKLAEDVEMEFCRVPAGEFLMGSNPKVDHQAFLNEQPQVKVLLPEFWMGRYPVTNRQYEAYLSYANHTVPRSNPPNEYLNYPVVKVHWLDCRNFCSWIQHISGLTVELPSEAQWEKAARGVDGRIYPWGNKDPDSILANFYSSVIQKFYEKENLTTVVGKYSPLGDSPYGCADMAGNVWEWTADWYSDHYQVDAQNNLQRPETGTVRVLRGGSCTNKPNYIRAACRGWRHPNTIEHNFGFRCVLTMTSN